MLDVSKKVGFLITVSHFVTAYPMGASVCKVRYKGWEATENLHKIDQDLLGDHFVGRRSREENRVRRVET